MRPGRTPYFQRLWLGLGLILAFALTGCGGAGSKYNEFLPKRIIVIGDEITYVGCVLASPKTSASACQGTDNYDRFSINNLAGSTSGITLSNNWVVQLAANYGLTLDKVIEPTVIPTNFASLSTDAQKDAAVLEQIRKAKLGAIAVGTPTSLGSVTPTSVSDQASLIPSYVAGDMVVVAGGANDILNVMQKNTVPNADTVVLKRGLTAERVNRILSDLGISSSTISTDRAFQIVKAAQDYQDIALDLINNKSQRNVFIAPVYDFSNSPDILSFYTPSANCASGTVTETSCRSQQLQNAIRLFNYVQRLLTDDNFNIMLFKSGEPRILTSSGSTSYDLFYVNLPFFSTVLGSAVYQFDALTITACRTAPNPVTDVKDCKWNGLLVTTNGVNPDFNGASTGAYFDQGGRYIYALNQYLTPTLQAIIGNTFALFMRGYNGW